MNIFIGQSGILLKGVSVFKIYFVLIYKLNYILIPLLVDYLSRGYHPYSSQWFGTDMVY
jgi:hypothetical protein